MVSAAGSKISLKKLENLFFSAEETKLVESVLTIIHILDASSHLYKRVCPSIRRSVRPVDYPFFLTCKFLEMVHTKQLKCLQRVNTHVF